MENTKEKIPAFAYLRTSSAANVGEDKDSDKRQMAAIEAYARANGYKIVQTFYDAAVSGADAIDTRPGMIALLDAAFANGTRTILVESPDRFARDAIVQELGYKMLKNQGITLIPTTSPTYFQDDSPTSELVRTILGAFAAFDRKTLTARLKSGRDRKSAELGKRIEGRKAVPADAVTAAKRLYRRNPKTGERRSLRQIATELESLGFSAYNPNSVRQMLINAGVYQPTV